MGSTTPGPDFYIAQSAEGTGTGADCADALPVTWFNNAPSWGTGTSQIGPGDTVHLCGNITTNLVAQGSGTAGNPITILFAPGATMSKPAWSGNIISVDGLSYVTINGGATGQIGGVSGNASLANGIIESTDNGTNLGNQLSAVGVSGKEAQHIIVENLVIRNLYVHVPGTDDGGGVAVKAYWNNDGSTPSDWTVTNDIFHDEAVGFTIGYGPNSQNFTFSSSTAYNVNWGGNAGDDGSQTSMTNLVVTGDYFHDWSNWDQTNDDNHHNGFYAWAEDSGTLNSVTYSDNVLGPDTTAGSSNDQTSDLFISGAGAVGPFNVFNNIFVNNGLNAFPSNGMVFVWPAAGSVTHIYNNTFIGPGGGDAIGIQGGHGGTQTFDVENNIAEGVTFIYAESNSSINLTSTNNIGYDLATDEYHTQPPDVAFGWSSNDTGVLLTLAAWQALGFDSNMSTTSPNLSGSYVPESPSSAIGAGVNLTSLCSSISGLCSDYSGNARPSTGTWDIGANQCTSDCDTSPDSGPNISSISVSAITSTSTTIAWATDESASSQVQYGTDTSYGSESSFSSSLVTSHSVILSSLSAGTTYHYRVISTDGSGVTSTSSDQTFTTSAAPQDDSQTITAASCNDSDVQAAVNSASDGDIVAIPAGTCTWLTGVSWTDKKISVIGAGASSTIINATAGFSVTINNVAEAAWRISGLTMQSATTSSMAIVINAAKPTTYSYGWRVDHVTFDYTGDTPDGSIVVYGTSYGLFDHDNFSFAHSVWIYVEDAQDTWTDASDPNYEQCWGSPSLADVCGRYMMSLPLSLGTADSVYFENDTFTSQIAGQAFFDTSYGGARVVFRDNTFTGGFLYSHGTRGNEIDYFQAELYDNNFIANSNWNYYPVRFEGGTGVIYDNTLSPGMYDEVGGTPTKWYLDYPRYYYSGWEYPLLNTCDGTNDWDGNSDTSAPGWPCLTQPGRGPGVTWAQAQAGVQAPSVPWLAWSNGTQIGCSTGGSCTDSVDLAAYNGPSAYISTTAHPNGDKDFCNGGNSMPSTCGNYTNNYTPFTYPYPLDANGMPESSGPSSPANYTLTYTAGSGGTLTGSASQVVIAGSDGSTVTAVPNSGYAFSSWSDSSTQNPRTDTSVERNITVSASFVSTGGGSSGGGGSVSLGGGGGPITIISSGTTATTSTSTGTEAASVSPVIPYSAQSTVPVSATLTVPATTQLTGSIFTGVQDSNVVVLQQVLANEGFLSPASVTGYFGPITEEALIKFQAAYGIATTPAQGAGLVGPKTKAIINQFISEGKYAGGVATPAAAVTVKTTAAAPVSTTTAPLTLTTTLYPTMETPSAVTLQKFLVAQGLLPSADVTGYYGSLTEKAVAAFQEKEGIVSGGTPATTGLGNVGPKTRAVINEILNGQTPIIPATVTTTTTAAAAPVKTVTATPTKVVTTPAKTVVLPTTTVAIASNPAPTFAQFTAPLKVGSTGPEVKELQQFLNAQGFTVAKTGPDSPGHETTTYDYYTATAVSAFQQAHASQILTPYGLTEGTGSFGDTTMEVANELLQL
jgi:peptidoglycan hydrolase-like protein with peptidoglycan-binding domain